MAQLQIPTLVGCGCETIVHGDHSGVEIIYCDAHQANERLHAVARAILEACDSIISNLDSTWGSEGFIGRVEELGEALGEPVAR